MRFPARPAPDYPYGRLRGRRPCVGNDRRLPSVGRQGQETPLPGARNALAGSCRKGAMHVS